MPLLPELIAVAVLQFLVIIAPGADFVVICRNSLVYSRRTGIYSALGLTLGILVHASYSLIGIGFIISRSIVLFALIKYLGAAYLIYLGYKSLIAKPQRQLDRQSRRSQTSQDLSKLAAVRMGFVNNILNPKVTLFFLSLFTQVINPLTPIPVQIWYGLQMGIMTFTWYTLVALVMSHPILKEKLLSVTHYLEKAMGAVLIALGIRVALSGVEK
ncbi:LysE family transporter [Chroococcidiopsis thermalis]|uniref:Lysine exporter protein (LYSE/YGGA) n=1 Tax=Chroococcidiopsis thermalis (strain PCC 7203) TaxID=251229 RepID=K9U6I6_CHRTP|nr:LysE family transporter [Chroococcidiopsis thermalis]AFY90717.1 Lysine exporter protein (LYSE/YGGA) [Chroococcidiopsis thermalis PCC 7203]PSB44187.1 amino acid transporter [Cyanosarcina cf. burmensis CCALA 770]